MILGHQNYVFVFCETIKNMALLNEKEFFLRIIDIIETSVFFGRKPGQGINS